MPHLDIVTQQAQRLGYQLLCAAAENNLPTVERHLKSLMHLVAHFKKETQYTGEDLEKIIAEKIIKPCLDHVDDKGNTALFWAVYFHNPVMFKKLESNGTDCNLVNYKGFSLHDEAIQRGYRGLSQGLASLQKQKAAFKHDEHEHYRQQVSIVKELGHVYGISDVKHNPISLKHPTAKNFKVIDFEGAHSCFSVPLLLQFVNAYQQSDDCNNTSFFKKITTALEKQAQYLNCNPTVTADTLIEMMTNNQLAILNLESKTNHDRHATTIAYYKNSLVYCNRGFGQDTETGTTVYLDTTQTAPVLLEPELQALCYGKNRVFQTQAEITAWVKNQTKHYTHSIGLPAKAQKHGTCSFVNAKSAIQGILYVLERERLIETGLTDPEALHTQSASYAAEEYKRFTKFMRDTETKKLIQDMLEALEKAPQTHNDILFYKQLLIHAIKAHYGSGKNSSPAKKADELSRVKMIFDALEGHIILKDIISKLEAAPKILFQSLEQKSDKPIESTQPATKSPKTKPTGNL